MDDSDALLWETLPRTESGHRENAGRVSRHVARTQARRHQIPNEPTMAPLLNPDAGVWGSGTAVTDIIFHLSGTLE